MTGVKGIGAPELSGINPIITATGRSGESGQGPFYEVTLSVRDGAVTEASCRTFGCFWAETIGSMAMAMIKGQTVAYCCEITEQALLERLIEGVPRSKEELPGMACVAVRQAAKSLSLSELPAID